MNNNQQYRIINRTIGQLLDLGLEESISSYTWTEGPFTLEQELQWRRYNPPSTWHKINSWSDFKSLLILINQRNYELDRDEQMVSRSPTTEKNRKKKARQANISSNKSFLNPDRQDRQTKINESQYWKKRRTVARQNQSKNRLSDHFEE